MKEWLIALTEPTIVIIDLMALLIIAAATLYAFIAAIRLALKGNADGEARRALWLGYGRWLVAGLTFQLAADIVESSITPTWEAIGQLGAVAVIRTFLNYFLERDLQEVWERQHLGTAEIEPTET